MVSPAQLVTTCTHGVVLHYLRSAQPCMRVSRQQSVGVVQTRHHQTEHRLDTRVITVKEVADLADRSQVVVRRPLDAIDLPMHDHGHYNFCADIN